MPENLIHKITITGPEGFHLEHELSEGLTIVGRQPTEGLTLPNGRVSRNHAQFELAKGSCEVMDLGSSNGTVLNGEKLFPKIAMPLVEGDVVTIDPFTIAYHIVPGAASPEPPAPSPAVAKPPKAAPAQAAAAPETSAPSPSKKTPAAPSVSAPAVQPSSSAAPKAAPPVAKPAVKGAGKKENGGAPPIPPRPGKAQDEPSPSELVPPGLSIYSERLISYLPGIYHTDFMRRFLGIFESLWIPVEWTVDNFDMFLSPGTSPEEFIPWLASWYDIVFDSTWTEDQRRSLLREAPQLFARRGTRWAMSKTLEIYTGAVPEIIDTGDKLEPHNFIVRVKSNSRPRDLVQALIEANKPAHTSFKLEGI